MDTRRHFLSKLTLASAALTQTSESHAQAPPVPKETSAESVRAEWVGMLTRVAEPVFSNLASNQLIARMPVEGPKAKERRNVTHLEAVGRTLAGLAPWLNQPSAGPEEVSRQRLANQVREGLTNALDPAAPDFINFTAGGQNLVDAAFLALGLARSRKEVWDQLPDLARRRALEAFQSTRKFKPPQNNWLLFAGMVEAFVASVGSTWKPEVIDAALSAHENWYKGDGVYGDGADFHWDYYNSFVIQPFLLELLDLLAPVTDRWEQLREKVSTRARRYAAVQERLIAPDGSFPPLGRSLCYRCGAFHHLALMAFRKDLPASVTSGQVRGALNAMIHSTLGAPNTFDAGGWLRIGLVGHQPSLAESYITTGSLYLCTLAFLPLGLASSEKFWTESSREWTSKQVWKGEDVPADHAI